MAKNHDIGEYSCAYYRELMARESDPTDEEAAAFIGLRKHLHGCQACRVACEEEIRKNKVMRPYLQLALVMVELTEKRMN